MVVDSSVWLEIFLEGKHKNACQKAVSPSHSWVPSIAIFEIYKKLKMELSETEALEAIGSLSQFPLLNLEKDISLLAADLSIEYGLAMADSIVLAHARHLGEKLLTLDNDFSEIPGATVIR